ncbi:hypothetical protein B0H10DRAFT_1958776 [Mycena sp. CBHHK59/15]|nr:hypothetical protein B0H10DRAFT_1958776 [Mycena sp. CBHHK59/15]
MWYDRIQYADIPSNSRGFKLGLRGSIANTREEYNLLQRLGVPVWLQLATLDLLVPDPQKETTCLSLHVETRLWSGMPVSISLKDIHKGKLVHNKPLEYYPPCVKEPRQYKSAARGYSVRFDIFNRDLKSADDVLEMVRSTNPTGVNHNVSSSLAHRVRETGSTAAKLMEQYASDRAVAPVMDADKNPPALIGCPGEKSKWYRQYIEICKSHNVSLWAPKHTEAWNMGSHNTYYPLHHDIQLIPKCKDLLLFVAPPPHLFLGIKKADKLNTFFFIWMCIRRPWLSHVHRDDGDPISWGLTTQKWREILGGYYWKLRHPKELDPVPFTLRRFWCHGGPRIFGDEAEDVWETDISPVMTTSLTGQLEPEHFADDGIKALILWDLALCHAQLQLDRADEILYAHSLKDARQHTIRRLRKTPSPAAHYASYRHPISPCVPRRVLCCILARYRPPVPVAACAARAGRPIATVGGRSHLRLYTIQPSSLPPDASPAHAGTQMLAPVYMQMLVHRDRSRSCIAILAMSHRLCPSRAYSPSWHHHMVAVTRSTTMTHRLRSGVGLYAVGFILNRTQIAAIAKRAFAPDFLASHGDDPVLAFKWHIRQHHCQVLVTVDPERFLEIWTSLVSQKV